MGRPVVSTTVGAHGLPWREPGETEGMVLADEPGAFAAACRALLDDPVRAQRLGELGRAAVSTRAATDVVAPRIARGR